MEVKRNTGLHDVNGEEIFEGDTLEYNNIEGKLCRFTVKWSSYWNKFIGDAYGEIYDLSPDYFCKAEKVNSNLTEVRHEKCRNQMRQFCMPRT